jgi:hypothetical protein
MAKTVRQLIIDSFYLSGITSRGLQTLSGDQEEDGLDLLNSILAFKSVDERKIPYFTDFDFPTISQEEKYFIDGLIEVSTLTFNFGEVRFSMQAMTRGMYLGSGRANNVYSLPSTYHVERERGGANIFMYPIPDRVYDFKIYGKFNLGSVTIDQDLELTLDKFYIEYLRYLLAQYICEFYDLTFSSDSKKRLEIYESKMTDVSPMDLTETRVNFFNRNTTNDCYYDANIGKGWRR